MKKIMSKMIKKDSFFKYHETRNKPVPHYN